MCFGSIDCRFKESGDRRSKVIRVYGARQGSEPTENKIFYTNNQYASRMTFRFANDRVVEISTGSQLN